MQMRRNGRNRKKILAWLMLVIMGVNCFDGSVPAGGVNDILILHVFGV